MAKVTLARAEQFLEVLVSRNRADAATTRCPVGGARGSLVWDGPALRTANNLMSRAPHFPAPHSRGRSPLSFPSV